LAKALLFPPEFVTVTVTAPAAAAGVVAEITLVFRTTTFVAAFPPNVTVAPDAKFVPLIVTSVPPSTGPVFGSMLVTVGVGTEAITKVAICITQLPEPLTADAL